ncbi:MAG TPA: metallophosphoesterase family protein, partial [Verrucomicrobiae bacterium]|nr:metallophosphoesterase family protein [Verrucomicrobiae bacterium]
LKTSEIRGLKVERAATFLTPADRQILGTEHISFSVNTPVRVSLLRDLGLTNEPFWLPEQGFAKTATRWKEDEDQYEVWQKDFPAGRVGLGVNSLRGGGAHYAIALTPVTPGAALTVTDLYPGQLRLDTLQSGVKPHVDSDRVFTNLPPALLGQTCIRTVNASRDDARLIDTLLVTDHPASLAPDNIILTWGGDPRSTQSIQWRTSSGTRGGMVLYKKKEWPNEPVRPFQPAYAQSTRIDAQNVVNNPTMFWHTAVLRDLEPDTTYVYIVGDGSREAWSRPAEFTTAPTRTKPFSFIYMGDAQNGLDTWGKLVRRAYQDRPDAAFYLMAGDLVNRGAERDDWDKLFHNAAGIYDHRQLVPVIGNHECQGVNSYPALYLKFFDLPRNGPPNLEPKRAYAFEYSNALFVILDSNLPPETQTAWLEQQLSQSKAKWKFVSYHHPAYSSVPRRDNKQVRDLWTPIFDKYHVDMALQGHDHAYLRTYPMNGQKRVNGPRDGTVYIVSVSGTKHYKQDKRNYTEVGMTNVSTFQVLDIRIDGDRLTYRAYDTEGKLRDELVIEK